MNITEKFMTEFHNLYKPDAKTLYANTARIMGTAVIGAFVLKFVDTGFAVFLRLVMR